MSYAVEFFRCLRNPTPCPSPTDPGGPSRGGENTPPLLRRGGRGVRWGRGLNCVTHK